MEKGKLTWSKADKAGHEVQERIVDFLIRRCQSTIPSLALSQAEAQQMQSL